MRLIYILKVSDSILDMILHPRNSPLIIFITSYNSVVSTSQ
jgi:hypothetical protein